MIDTDELLSRLEARGVRNIDIARALDLPDSRVPEIKTRRRALKLDEAAKLVRAFGLEPGQAPEIPHQVLRLVVRYLASELETSPSEEQVEELTKDVRAFADFVADPKVRQSIEAAEGFFRAMQFRRPRLVPGGQPGNDPERSH